MVADANIVQDTITGLLLAGIGQVERGKKNFLVVDSSKCLSTSDISLITCSLRDAGICHRGSLPRVHRAEGHRHPPHKPACTRRFRITACHPLTPVPGCREDQTHRRQVPASLPRASGDTLKGPPVRYADRRLLAHSRTGSPSTAPQTRRKTPCSSACRSSSETNRNTLGSRLCTYIAQ